MLDALPRAETGENMVLLVLPVGGDDAPNGLPAVAVLDGRGLWFCRSRFGHRRCVLSRIREDVADPRDGDDWDAGATRSGKFAPNVRNVSLQEAGAVL